VASHQKLRRELAERLEQLRARQQKIEADIRRRRNPDWEDQALEAENDDVLADIEDRDLREIGQLEQAIERIDAGTYGECASCGAAIPEARLAAMPAATLCVRCAA
jgi:RNA polymerase-binding protein DksA